MNRCFDFYLLNKCAFLSYIAKTACKADSINIEKLRKIFPAIIAAKDQNSWETPPEGDFPVVSHEGTITEIKSSTGCVEGSFGWYMERSGDYVKGLTSVIVTADEKNLELIRGQYPQMVAAFEMDTWSSPPDGFQWNGYDSPRVISLQLV